MGGSINRGMDGWTKLGFDKWRALVHDKRMNKESILSTGLLLIVFRFKVLPLLLRVFTPATGGSHPCNCGFHHYCNVAWGYSPLLLGVFTPATGGSHHPVYAPFRWFASFSFKICIGNVASGCFSFWESKYNWGFSPLLHGGICPVLNSSHWYWSQV